MAEELSPGCAPSILITFIGMALFKYDRDPQPGCETVYMFAGQVSHKPERSDLDNILRYSFWWLFRKGFKR